MSELPVVVIGAGPLGLAAAAQLLERGLTPLVLEAGTGPGSAVEQWEHVRTFSPWPELIDPAAARLLGSTGWTAKESGFPTGREWIDDYLAPLAGVLGERVRFGVRVQAVSRLGRDRLVTPAAPRRRSSCISTSARVSSSGCWRGRSSTPPAPGGNRIPLARTVLRQSANAPPPPRAW